MTDADRVFVTAADYNPQVKKWPFDGEPFRCPGGVKGVYPAWLLDALKRGTIHLSGCKEADYAMWRVKTPDGDVLAGPGDLIVKEDRGLAVFPSRAAAP